MTPLTPSVQGSTELMFVIADPVVQVKAPAAVNHLLARAGIDAIVVPAQVRPAHLDAFVRTMLHTSNVRGFFASIPHKTALADIGLVERLDPVARAAGAVNAVRRGADGVVEGALFDGAGFLAALRYHGVALQGARVLLVGAGGAGLAIAAALAGGPLSELRVHDADPARAAALAARCGATASFPISPAAAGSHAAGFELIVQATPAGLRPGDALPLDPASADRGAVLVDILMTPRPTPLVLAARARGLRAYMGHEMLVQQLPEYLDFFGYAELARALRTDRSGWLDEVRRLIEPAVV